MHKNCPLDTTTLCLKKTVPTYFFGPRLSNIKRF